MEKPEIAVLRRFTPGISVTLIADEFTRYFREKGHKVVEIDTKDRGFDFSPCHKRHVLSLDEAALPDMLARTLYTFPRRVVSLWVNNWEEISLIQQMSYLSCFMKPKVNSATVVHVSHSHYTDRIIKDFARKHLAPSVTRGLESRMKVNLFGIGSEFQSRHQNDPDKLIVPYNRVNQSQKNIQLHVEVTRQYLAMEARRGRKPTVDFFYSAKFAPDRKAYDVGGDVYTYIPQYERQKFVEAIPNYGMFLSTSLFESFGIYYLELLASGVVGVFLDKPWVRQLLPNYRFIAPKGDLAGLMSWVRENYEEASAYVHDEVIPFIRETYSFERFCADLLKEVVGADEHGG